ncbi:response regulator transcription factor [Mucilaginibacter mali]|uniref:Response regulator transcription factor n=1 Tax=Mucilaginibacter mali TaxID=2740462 RepID=A0A7D4UN99_9SPHI|nr:response regulator [Mucilaginibacter mali]QKJ28720.1 response regulator transcription factor [Mucilaginibacter mali]
MKIVVIEDNPDIMDVVDFILSSDGHELIPCNDGSIAANLHNINPDLIFIDEFLPVKRGSEICKNIKANPLLQHMPVVLISTVPHLATIASQSGADAYLEKPFELSDFLAITNSFVKV